MHELQKMKKKLEVEKDELQMALEEAESSLEVTLFCFISPDLFRVSKSVEVTTVHVTVGILALRPMEVVVGCTLSVVESPEDCSRTTWIPIWEDKRLASPSGVVLHAKSPFHLEN